MGKTPFGPFCKLCFNYSPIASEPIAVTAGVIKWAGMIKFLQDKSIHAQKMVCLEVSKCYPIGPQVAGYAVC